MKFFDEKRHLPPGRDWESLRSCLIWGHGLSLLTLILFLSRYFQSVDSLYSMIQKLDGTLVRQLTPGRTVAPFWELMKGGPLRGAEIYTFLMLHLVHLNYQWHTKGSMSVYLMRRLPDRWERHRRCWAVPVMSTIAELLIFAVGIFLCWLLWRFATPAGHLPM